MMNPGTLIPASWWERPVEGWLWFALGMSGNIVFGSRFFIQWIYSEKRRESHVPVIFWWISVVGTLLLLIYFIRIHNMVGIVGHGPNLVPYTRNLMLIYRKRRAAPGGFPVEPPRA